MAGNVRQSRRMSQDATAEQTRWGSHTAHQSEPGRGAGALAGVEAIVHIPGHIGNAVAPAVAPISRGRGSIEDRSRSDQIRRHGESRDASEPLACHHTSMALPIGSTRSPAAVRDVPITPTTGPHTYVAQTTPGHARRRRLSGARQRDLAAWAIVPVPHLLALLDVLLDPGQTRANKAASSL